MKCTNTSVLAAFPGLRDINDAAWLTAAKQTQIIRVPAGAALFRNGDTCKGYVLVLDGSVRVQKVDAQGREIVLYRVEEGQTCMLTTTCLLGGQDYPAEGIAEGEVRIAILPSPAFDRAIAGSKSFRRFVLGSIGQRISDLMLLVEDIAFGRMDVRLAHLLLKRTQDKGSTLCCTHQELAVELGTAREVISRLLKDFEHKGLVGLSRGSVKVMERDRLQSVADREL